MTPLFVNLSVCALEAADAHSLVAKSGVSRWWLGVMHVGLVRLGMAFEICATGEETNSAKLLSLDQNCAEVLSESISLIAKKLTIEIRYACVH